MDGPQTAMDYFDDSDKGHRLAIISHQYDSKNGLQKTISILEDAGLFLKLISHSGYKGYKSWILFFMLDFD